VLVLGEGDGRALKQMLAAAPRARFDVIEASIKMIALARDRIGASDRVSFYCQDVLSGFLPGTNYDAVVAFFFLDCFTEPELKELLTLIAPKLIPGTIWLVSEFAIPTKGWRRLHAKAWIWLMYRFFSVTTGLRTRALPPIDWLLSEHGLHRTDIHKRRWSMIASEVFVYQGLVEAKSQQGCPPAPHR
jgi:hypothetical protein